MLKKVYQLYNIICKIIICIHSVYFCKVQLYGALPYPQNSIGEVIFSRTYSYVSDTEQEQHNISRRIQKHINSISVFFIPLFSALASRIYQLHLRSHIFRQLIIFPFDDEPCEANRYSRNMKTSFCVYICTSFFFFLVHV